MHHGAGGWGCLATLLHHEALCAACLLVTITQDKRTHSGRPRSAERHFVDYGGRPGPWEPACSRRCPRRLACSLMEVRFVGDNYQTETDRPGVAAQQMSYHTAACGSTVSLCDGSSNGWLYLQVECVYPLPPPSLLPALGERTHSPCRVVSTHILVVKTPLVPGFAHMTKFKETIPTICNVSQKALKGLAGKGHMSVHLAIFVS